MGGATKPHHVKGTAKAVNLTLSEEEYASLEELYTPHSLLQQVSSTGGFWPGCSRELEGTSALKFSPMSLALASAQQTRLPEITF